MAARQLIGFLRYINDFTRRSMNTLHVMTDPEKELTHLFFNCHKASVLDVLSKPVPSGYIEVSASQNLFDNMGVPDEIEVDVQDLMQHRIVDIKQNEGPYDKQREKQDNGPMAILAYVLILHYGLDIDLYGQVSLSKDPVILAHLDHSQLQTPGIRNVSAAEAGPRDSEYSS